MPTWIVEYDEVATTPVTAEVEAEDEETARMLAESGEVEKEMFDGSKRSVLRRNVHRVRAKKEG